MRTKPLCHRGKPKSCQEVAQRCFGPVESKPKFTSNTGDNHWPLGRNLLEVEARFPKTISSKVENKARKRPGTLETSMILKQMFNNTIGKSARTPSARFEML